MVSFFFFSLSEWHPMKRQNKIEEEANKTGE